MDETVQAKDELLMGSALAALGQEIGLSDADIEQFNHQRDNKPAEPMVLE